MFSSSRIGYESDSEAGTQRITLVTDIPTRDNTTLDGYVQTIFSPDTTMQQWRRMIKEGTVRVRTRVVVFLVGNCELPLTPNLSPSGQMKKLLVAAWTKWGKHIDKMVVLSVLPRPDRETEFENEIRLMNLGFGRAVREVKKHFQIAHNTSFLPVHKIFLEYYEYFDFATGHTATLLRVMKPVTLNFVAGKSRLNRLGLYHLRSYILQEMGVLHGVNSWTQIPVKFEPAEVSQAKREAWLKTKQAEGTEVVVEEEQGDTDVEDEVPVVVPDSVSDPTTRSSETGEGRLSIPVYVQGRRVVVDTSGDSTDAGLNVAMLVP